MAGDLAVSPSMVISANRDEWVKTDLLCKTSSDIFFADTIEIFNTPSFDVIKNILVSKHLDIACLALRSAAKFSDYSIGKSEVSDKALNQASQYPSLFEKAGLKGWELLIECFLNIQEGALDEEWIKGLERNVNKPESIVNVHEALIKKTTSTKKSSDLRNVLLKIICNQSSPLQYICQVKSTHRKR